MLIRLKLITCICFWTLSFSLSAQNEDNWIWIGTANDGAEYYQKNSYNTKYYYQASSIQVWQKIENKDKIEYYNGKKIVKKGGSRVSLIEYFCQDETYRAVQSTEYSNSGEVIGSFAKEFGELIRAIPGTMGDLSLRKACELKKD